MIAVEQRWERLYCQTPLCDIPYHFQNIRRSPFTLQYLTKVLTLCPQGGRTCETGVGSGLGAIWLSLRGIHAEGIDYAPGIVERARQANNLLEGYASFRVGDLFSFYTPATPRYHVIHHQGVLEHFTSVQIRAALTQQVAMAEWVVFSVPSVYYPFEPEFGDERLLPLAEWKHLLRDFDIETLTYYGDPQHGEREHILCVLRGQLVTNQMLARMNVPEEPYPEGISAIVHTRNEKRHIAACLESLQGWADEIIVCDMESEDETVAIARSFTDNIVLHPHISNFDRARNVSAMRACYRWIFYLDADERVPPGLGPALRNLSETQGDTFAAALVPFRHHFVGHWMKCLYPGYTAPRLLKNGKFYFNARLHSGAHVDGSTVCFPADNPDLALVHYSYDSLSHYLDKLNRYTDGESANMHQDGQLFHWQSAIRHFIIDFRDYYDRMNARQDGVHGFIYSFLSAFYRFEQHAKLYERRFQKGQLHPEENMVPVSVEQVLEYALSIVREQPRHETSAIRVQASRDAVSVVWSGPILDPSGYGEENRELVLALEEAGTELAIQPLNWSEKQAAIPKGEQERLLAMASRPVTPGFVQIMHTFAPHFTPHPDARVKIGRTLFETDRLPTEWVAACNRMDYIWVATEFNRQTFAQAGVEEKKLVVIPGCFDPAPYRQKAPSTALTHEIADASRFQFLTVFDWTLHKGWDVLLRAFLEAFPDRDDVGLILKVWSTIGYSAEGIMEQAATHVKETLGVDLLIDTRIRFVSNYLSRAEMLALYQACDAFVLPSRGEGWGRPLMEAMACGLPTIGTNWSGNTAFMKEENSYLLDYILQSVPEVGWREIPTYRGHRWAEPNQANLQAIMQAIVADPKEAKVRGVRGQSHISANFNREVVGKLISQEIARVEKCADASLVMVGDTRNETLADKSGETKKDERAETSIPKSRKERVKSPVSPKEAKTEALTVRWEGSQFVWHSLAHVNREMCLGLLDTGRVTLSIIPNEPLQFIPEETSRFHDLAIRVFAPLPKPAQIHIRHFFPPRLNRPEEGQFVLIQPWEYGYLPAAWVEPIVANVDEVWCYSEYVREVYKASGIPKEMLYVIPLGVDTEVFTPDALPYIFTTEPGAKRLAERRDTTPFVFLFVGGTLNRKGIDILLDAYLRAFSAYDDVCLVIKDTGTQTVYRGQNEQARILELVNDPTRPSIIYLEDDLEPVQMAGVYTASNCLVQPYRGEGFCLPALEAMACGRPALVPEGGPTDDFVDDTVGWRMPAEKRPHPQGKIGEWECVGIPWQFEVSPDTLARQMRQVFAQRDVVRQKGQAALMRVRAGWTWKHTSAVALKRLEALASREVPVRSAQSLSHAIVSTPVLPTPHRETEQAESEKNSSNTNNKLVVKDRRAGRGHKQGNEASNNKNGSISNSGRKMPTISLCMIVKNEERVLGDCLKSVQPWVDEIILVDTGSTDKTVEIAKAGGAKVYHFPWCDDFSAARNVSLSHATGDWLFWMDADDTIPEECAKKMKELALLAEDRVTGYLMQVHIPPAPGENGFTQVDHVKLFRNLPGLRFEGRIHEQILEPLHRLGGTVERSDLYVIHSGYDYSPEGQKHKRERDLRILELDLADRPNHPFVHFNLGMTYHHLRDFDKAILALERCLNLSKPHESTIRKVYALLTNSHLEQGDQAKARQRLEEGLALFPNDPELLFRAGIVYRELGDLKRAEESYLALFTRREHGHIDSLDVSMTGFKAHHNLALIYQDMGRMQDAEKEWRAALQDHNSFTPSWLGLGELYLHLRRFEDVQAIAQRLDELAPEQASNLRSRIADMAHH